jgi:hypothetical protein
MKCLILLLMIGVPAGAEVRTFHDVKGRAMEAELVKARGPNIVVRMDKKEVPVPLKQFSREDQTVILQWIATDPGAIDYRFDCREAEKEVPRTDGEEGPGLRGYEVTVANRCLNTVDGIRMCYRVFLDDRVDPIGSWFNSRKLMFKAGDEELPALAYGKSAKVVTRGHQVDKTRSNGFSGQPERDRLRGVWVRFFRFGTEVGSWKSGAVPKCEWPESSAEKARLEGDRERQRELVASFAGKAGGGGVPAGEPEGEVKREVAKGAAGKSGAGKNGAGKREGGKAEGAVGKVGGEEKGEDVPEEIKIFEMEDTAK